MFFGLTKQLEPSNKAVRTGLIDKAKCVAYAQIDCSRLHDWKFGWEFDFTIYMPKCLVTIPNNCIIKNVNNRILDNL